MGFILASATAVPAMVIADYVLKILLEETTKAGIGDAAKAIAGLRKDRKKRRRFQELMQKAWQDWAADAVRAALIERQDAWRTFQQEALKVLLFAEEPNLGTLERTYGAARTLLGGSGQALPPWQEVVGPLEGYFQRLRARLMDDQEYAPTALRKEQADRLRGIDATSAALLAAVERAQTPEGALRTVVEERRLSAEELERARVDYMDMVRREHEYLDLAGLAPKVQNRVVKIRLQDVFIPLKARPEVARGRAVPREIAELLAAGAVDAGEAVERLAAWDRELGETLRAEAVQEQASGARWAERAVRRLAERGYTVPGWERAALGAGEEIDIAGLLELGQVVVLGHPGSGKSTLLKYLAYGVAAGTEELGEQALGRVPLLVKVKEWMRRSEQWPSLKDYLCHGGGREEDAARCALLERAIDGGNALILLDAHARALAAEEVRRLVADCPGNLVVLTSRIVGYDGSKLAGHFRHATLEPLPKEAIAQFVGQWYAAIEREAAGTEERVQAAYGRAEELQQAIEGNPGVQGLAQNPLLLTIIALVNRQGRKLPDRRVELYQHAAETLIESWPFVQRGVRMDTRMVMGILEPVGYRVFAQRGSEELNEEALRPLLIERIAEKRGCSGAEAEQGAEELLPQITEQSGILVKRGVDQWGRQYYGFLHQTFTEYFAARHLVGRWLAGGLDLEPYARNPRWREVVLLMAGHLGLMDERESTRFVAQVLQLPDEYPQLQRNLLLVGEILADGTSVEARASQYVVRQATELACRGAAGLRLAGYGLLQRLGESVHGCQADEATLLMLLDLSRDKDARVRRKATAALGAVGKGYVRVLETLLTLAQDRDAGVRGLAAGALQRVGAGDARALEALVMMSADEAQVVRESAEQVLCRMAEKDSRVRERLLALSRDGAVGRRAQAVRVLRRVAEAELQVTERLLALSQDDAAEVRAQAALALWKVAGSEPRAIEALLALSRDESAEVRAGAVGPLGESAESEPRAMERLLALSRDGVVEVRVEATVMLGEVAGSGPQALEALVALSWDESAEVRAEAAWALGPVAESEPTAMERLLALSRDESAEVRAGAASVLGLVAGSEPRTMEALLALSRDESAEVRAWAAWSLGQVARSEPRAVERLLALTRDRAAEVRSQAAGALEEVAGSKPRAVERLLSLVRDRAAEVRRRAAGSLGQVAGSELRAMEALLALSRDGVAEVRASLAQVFAEQGDMRAVPILVAWVKDARESEYKGLRSVGEGAYWAAMAVLARCAPEPPGQVEQPEPVRGPWDEG